MSSFFRTKIIFYCFIVWIVWLIYKTIEAYCDFNNWSLLTCGKLRNKHKMSVQRTLYILLFAFVLISGFSVSGRSHPKKCTSLECDINEDAGSPAIKVAKRDLLPSLQQPNELSNTIVTSDFSKKNNHHINMLSSSKINDVRGPVSYTHLTLPTKA